MKDTILGSLLIGGLLVLLIGLIITGIHETFGEFEYTSMDGEKGNASMCIISYGDAYCRDSDGTKIIVKSYRKIK